MSDFTSALRQRVVEAQRSLVEARETGDDYLVQLSLGQIESLARLAAENQVTVDGIEESLAPYGLSMPTNPATAGRSGHGVVDLDPSRLNVSP